MRNLVKMVVVVMVSMTMRMDAHTPVETNDAVRTMLQVIASPDDDNWGDSLSRLRILRTKERHPFYDIEIDGWTRVEKEAVFLSYLNNLKTVDFDVQTNSLISYANAAIQHCRDIFYTNAIPALIGMTANSTCSSSEREMAIGAVIDLSTVSDQTTSFVESIVTNNMAYSVKEKCRAIYSYANQVENAAQSPEVRRATQMFVRHRHMNRWIMVNCDSVISAHVEGYASSSNRLKYANWALTNEPLPMSVRKYFVNVTNELLSVDQPLRWINLSNEGQ